MKRVLLALPLFLLLGACEKARLDQQVRELCAKDGGIKVYETVRVPAEKFDKWGNVEIPAKEYAKSDDAYYMEMEIGYLVRGNPELTRTHFKVFRRSDGKLLGEAIYYGRRGGDLPGPWHDSSFRCPEIGTGQNLERSIFLR